MPFGSRGHYGDKSTVSAVLRYRPGTRATGPLVRERRREEGGTDDYSDVCAMGSADGELAGGTALSRAAGTAGSPAAGTVASDLMSMRQPVSLAASLAFCPSMPIASDSW